LPRLDIVGEVVIHPTCVTEIGNLDVDDIQSVSVVRLALVAGRGRTARLVKRNAGYLPAKHVAELN
jgi:hypothetical protein